MGKDIWKLYEMAANGSVWDMVYGAALFAVSAYVGWVHRRQTKTEERISHAETSIASMSGMRDTLSKMDSKLEEVSRVVYMIAGMNGIKP